jgi:hypothetical protein
MKKKKVALPGIPPLKKGALVGYVIEVDGVKHTFSVDDFYVWATASPCDLCGDHIRVELSHRYAVGAEFYLENIVLQEE